MPASKATSTFMDSPDSTTVTGRLLMGLAETSEPSGACTVATVQPHEVLTCFTFQGVDPRLVKVTRARPVSPA